MDYETFEQELHVIIEFAMRFYGIANYPDVDYVAEYEAYVMLNSMPENEANPHTLLDIAENVLEV